MEGLKKIQLIIYIDSLVWLLLYVSASDINGHPRLNNHFAFSIKKGRLDEAEQSLLRVFGSDYDAKKDVINISENLQHLRNVRQSDTLDVRLQLAEF